MARPLGSRNYNKNNTQMGCSNLTLRMPFKLRDALEKAALSENRCVSNYIRTMLTKSCVELGFLEDV